VKDKLSLAGLLLIAAVFYASYRACAQQEEFLYRDESIHDPFLSTIMPDGKLRTQWTAPLVQQAMPLKVKLSGIFTQEGRNFAIIDNRVYKEGEFIGEIKIEKIVVNEERVNEAGKRVIFNGIKLKYGESIYEVPLRKESK
jgi:hypothetical protein